MEVRWQLCLWRVPSLGTPIFNASFQLFLLSLPAAPGILQLAPPCTERDVEGGRGRQRAAATGFWSQVCSANAVILICVNLFFYAYFA